MSGNRRSRTQSNKTRAAQSLVEGKVCVKKSQGVRRGQGDVALLSGTALSREQTQTHTHALEDTGVYTLRHRVKPFFSKLSKA